MAVVLTVTCCVPGKSEDEQLSAGQCLELPNADCLLRPLPSISSIYDMNPGFKLNDN